MIPVEYGIPLAHRTTLGLGGAAATFVHASDVDTLVGALRWADTRGCPSWILGGGSNVVIGDDGLDGLVIEIGLRGLQITRGQDGALLRIAAGEPWDDVVARATAEGLSGIECLSGIPGLAGATPIQNVGAYGQEVADVLVGVHVYDRKHERRVRLTAAECALSYRDSALKRTPNRWVVLEVELELAIDGVPQLRYGELQRSLEGQRATPQRVRDSVLSLRRRKSMVIDASDPNRCSAGSFFTNPVVDADVAAEVERRAGQRGLLAARAMPQWPSDNGTVKLAAGWLIEAAGFKRGDQRGPVGLSTAHALALVHHGGGTTAMLLDFAREIRDGVAAAFGVELVPEPVMLGTRW